jgi:hypothetical protein
MNFIFVIKGCSNMTGTNCDLFTHNQSRSYLNHLVFMAMSSFRAELVTVLISTA